jgi:hypothetical protein
MSSSLNEPDAKEDRMACDSSDDELVDVKATKGNDEVVTVEKWDKEVLRGEYLDLKRNYQIRYTSEVAGHLDT